MNGAINIRGRRGRGPTEMCDFMAFVPYSSVTHSFCASLIHGRVKLFMINDGGDERLIVLARRYGAHYTYSGAPISDKDRGLFFTLDGPLTWLERIFQVGNCNSNCFP